MGNAATAKKGDPENGRFDGNKGCTSFRLQPRASNFDRMNYLHLMPEKLGCHKPLWSQRAEEKFKALLFCTEESAKMMYRHSIVQKILQDQIFVRAYVRPIRSCWAKLGMQVIGHTTPSNKL